MPDSPQIVPTVGSIAARLGVPIHRVVYIIASRKINPSGRAGNTRIFNDGDIEQIASELRRIGRDRESDHG